MDISVEVVSLQMKGKDATLKVNIATTKKEAMRLSEWMEEELPLILNKQTRLVQVELTKK